MCHPILLGVVGGILAAKLLYRFRGGGGCARRFRDGGGGCGGGYARRWGRWSRRHGGGAPDAADLGVKLSDVAGKLELNARQKEEASEVFARLTGAFGDRVEPGTRLHAVLETISAEPFNEDAAADALGIPDGPPSPADKELLDGVEHVHNILTNEQREKLRAILT
ncbi:MAG TPA: hypothetical protein VFF06_34010 [Polyangia bacterium]|nr:hypothetical protein [Polyangia bacterium]